MKRKKMLTLLLVFVLTVASAGCSTLGEGNDKAKTKRDKSDIVITVATRYSNDNPTENYYRQKVEEFNKMDNGIKVKMDNISTESDYLDKLRTSFANGDVPNVFLEFGGSRILDYLEADALVDLKPYLYADNKEWYNHFYDTMWGQSTYKGYDGIYAVPFGSYFVALFYNKDLFKKAGLEPPKTIDEMLSDCAKFKEMGVLPFQVGEKDNYRFGHFNNNLVIKTLGVDAVDKLASRELKYDSKEMMETYQIMADMVNKGYFGKDILDTDQTTENAAFLQGNVAMHYDGTWFIPNNLFGTDFYNHVGVVPFPYGNKSCANYAQGGSSDLMYVTKLNHSDAEIKASVEFLKYITSPEYFQGLDEVAQTIVPVKFEKSSKSPENPLLDDAIAIQNNIVDMRVDVQNYDSKSYMLDTVRSALQGLAMGDSPEKCAQNIVGRLKEDNGN